MPDEKLLDYVRKSGRTPTGEKLIGYPGMAAQIGIPAHFMLDRVRKVPCLRIGHKTVKFWPSQVRTLTKFEVPRNKKTLKKGFGSANDPDALRGVR